MAATASVTIPVRAADAAQRFDILAILGATAGVSDVALDERAEHVTFGFQFPGHIDSVLGRLRGRGLATGASLSLRVPVKNLSGAVVDPSAFLADIRESPAVVEAGFDGHTVTATLVASTSAMRYLYEEIVVHKLTALDVPTVAGKHEYTL